MKLTFFISKIQAFRVRTQTGHRNTFPLYSIEYTINGKVKIFVSEPLLDYSAGWIKDGGPQVGDTCCGVNSSFRNKSNITLEASSSGIELVRITNFNSGFTIQKIYLHLNRKLKIINTNK